MGDDGTEHLTHLLNHTIDPDRLANVSSLVMTNSERWVGSTSLGGGPSSVR